jgi:hypothetical protein
VCTVAADGEGTCQAGPTDSVCQTEFFRTCTSNADCPAAGDSCGIKTRGCLGPTDATGSATGPVTRTGVANRAQPLQVAVFCISATSAPAVNTAGGLPGPAGLRLLTNVCIEESCP